MYAVFCIVINVTAALKSIAHIEIFLIASCAVSKVHRISILQPDCTPDCLLAVESKKQK